MAWALLILAGLFETGWAIGLKYSEGFTKFWPALGTLLSMGISVWLLGITIKWIPIGTAYSIWVGMGAIGTILVGIVLFDEPSTTGRLVSLALLIAGIIGLHLTATS